MSYNIAYTSQFGDPSGLLWRVEIWRDNAGVPLEIGLDADEPVIIEWQETKLQDAVCPSQCTLKVVNDTDRQMVPLATDEYAFCKVFRDGKLYWTGVLDQGVYEEPYSYNDAYVTEITFSDFGALNRFDFHPFSQAGRSDHIVSLRDIVSAALTLICLDNVPLAQNISMILPGWGGNHAHLHHLYVNSERFEGMTYREVLERILQPLSYRIVQKAGAVWVYDAEWMFDNATVTTVTWKGDDARLSFGEVYGKFDLKFDRDSRPVIADGSLDPDDPAWPHHKRYFALYYGNNYNDVIGFYVEKAKTLRGNKYTYNSAHFFRTESFLTDSNTVGIARRVCCYDTSNQCIRNILENSTNYRVRDASTLFAIDSRFLTKVLDADAYKIRVSLSLLFSPKYNPFEPSNGKANIDPYDWEKWKGDVSRVYIPVKLHLLGASGSVWHYKNARLGGSDSIVPEGLEKGEWIPGPASWWDMALSFYNDGNDGNPLDGWSDNRMTIEDGRTDITDFYKKRSDGEYLPMPPESGLLSLVISDTIVFVSKANQFESWFDKKIRWQLYQNATITVVRSRTTNDNVDKDEVRENPSASSTDSVKDTYSEDSFIGTVQDGVSPACLGLLLKSTGDAYDGFIKKGVKQSLLRHRLNILQDQLSTPHSILSGTAELTPQMCIRSDASTAGKFLVTALRQDPRSGTEEVSMTRISPGGERYAFSWSDPVCVTEEEGYRHQWGSPVCIKVPERYAFSWSGPVCARVSVIVGPCWNDI